MKERLKKVALYALQRAQEPSSWAGVAALLSLLHHKISGEQAANLTMVGIMLAGFVAVAAKG